MEAMQLPETYTRSMRELLGEEYDAYIRSLEAPRLYGLRVNTAKISVEEFERIAPFPVKRIPYIPNGFFYDGEACQPAKHPYYFAGLYYLQDPSAMTPASRLPVKPGDRVLDLCAAPGGKSTELAARLCGSGFLVANDISVKRAKALQKNIELFGIGNSLITTEYPEKLAQYFPSFFDKILIDAPCSGEGMFRKDPAMVKAWSEESPDQYAAMQEDIVRHALPMLAPGGFLLYSTCTFSPCEDEGTVMKILKMDPSLSLVDIEPYEGFAPGRPDAVPDGEDCLKKCVRIFPHRMDGEGHFLALFKKDGAGPTGGAAEPEAAMYPDSRPQKISKNKSGKNARSSTAKGLSKEERSLWEEFVAGLKPGADDTYRDPAACLTEATIESHDGMLYADVDGLPSVKGLRFLRSGLFLGECKKKRFEPGQALAMALRADNYDNVLDLPADDDRVIRYLKGETITLTDPGLLRDGLVLVCVDHYPLGWGKKQGQTIKNRYHAGWRLM